MAKGRLDPKREALVGWEARLRVSQVSFLVLSLIRPFFFKETHLKEKPL